MSSDIRDTLEEVLKSRPLTLMGIGNELRCDDGFGSYLIRSLRNFARKYLKDRLEGLTFVDAGNAPELFTDIISSRGGTLLIIDVIRAEGLKPGDVAVLELVKNEEVSAPVTTHYINLPVFLKLVNIERAYLLGVVPECLDFDLRLSRTVAKVYTWLFRIITSLL